MSSTATTQPSQAAAERERARTDWPNEALSDAGGADLDDPLR
jgi:hypothetical protein